MCCLLAAGEGSEPATRPPEPAPAVHQIGEGSNPVGEKRKAAHRSVLLVAAGEGFEPSQTESESAVLPLHNPAKSIIHYTEKTENVNPFFYKK